MQDNPQPDAGYNNPQEQHPVPPYDDQMTLAAPQMAGEPPFAYEQIRPGVVQPEKVPLATVPQRKLALSPSLLIGGAVVIVLLALGVAGFFLLPALTAPAHPQTTAATPAPAATQTVRKNIYAPYLAQYRETIRDQVAQGLHLSSAQLQTQLGMGQTLSSIATAQNVPASQLQTIVTTAFQNGFQPALSGGNLTQKQLDVLVKRMLKQPKTLDRYLAAQVHVKKGVSATPTAINQ